MRCVDAEPTAAPTHVPTQKPTPPSPARTTLSGTSMSAGTRGEMKHMNGKNMTGKTKKE